MVLENVPIGKVSSAVIFGGEVRTTFRESNIERDNFWGAYSNNQMDVVHHSKTLKGST